MLVGPAIAIETTADSLVRDGWGASMRGPVMATAPQLSEMFTSQAQESFNDPVDPFTLYGTVLCAALPFGLPMHGTQQHALMHTLPNGPLPQHDMSVAWRVI